MPAQLPIVTSWTFTLLLIGNPVSGSTETTARTIAAAQSSPASQAAANSFTDRDLDAYERGLKREIEAVRAAQKQATAATDAQERGRAMQAQWEDATVPQGAEAAGLPVDRYRRLRTAVNEVFSTLDMQGKIDGPLSIDLSRASATMKQRLGRDAFSDLSSASAVALRARMDRLVPIWIEYVTLVAVAG